LYLPAIGFGALILFVGAAMLYYGVYRMSPDDHIDMGLGSTMGRLDLCLRGGVIIFIGFLALAVGLLINV